MASAFLQASQFSGGGADLNVKFRSNIAILLLMNNQQMDFHHQLRTESNHNFGNIIVKKITETPSKSKHAECQRYRYIHTSHKQGKITVAKTPEQLLSSKEDSKLQQCFHFFHKIKSSGEPIQELIIVTNMSFDEVDLLRNHMSLVPHHLDEDILDIEKQTLERKLVCYKLKLGHNSFGRPTNIQAQIPSGMMGIVIPQTIGAKLNRASVELTRLPQLDLSIWSDVKPLADVLHTCAVFKKMSLDISNACLKRYHVSLFREHVLVKEESAEKAIFHPDFVNGNNYSRGAADLRQQIINTWTDIGDWKTLTFRLSPNFGEKSSDGECDSLPIFAVEDDIREFFDKLVFVIIPDDIPLEEIVHKKVSKLLDLEATNFDSASIANRMSNWIAKELSDDDKWLSFKTVKKMWRLIVQSNTLSVDFQSDILEIHEPEIRPLTTLGSAMEFFLISSTGSEKTVMQIKTVMPEATAARVICALKTMGIRNYLVFSPKCLKKYRSEIAAILESGILDVVVAVCQDDLFIDVYGQLAPSSSVSGSSTTRRIIISNEAVEAYDRQDNRGAGKASCWPSASHQQVRQRVPDVFVINDEPFFFSTYIPSCVQMNVKQETATE